MKKLKSVISLFVVVCLLCGTTVTVTHATNTNNNGGVLIADNDEDLPLGSFNETGEIETIEKPGYNSDADIQWRDETNGSNKGHDYTVSEACKNLGLSDSEISIVKYSAMQVDKAYGGNISNKILAFHGRGNYVANIRFVSNFLQLIKVKYSLEVALDKAAAKFPELIKKNGSNKTKPYVNNSSGKKNTVYFDTIPEAFEGSPLEHAKEKYSDGIILEQMIDALILIYNKMGVDSNKGLFKGKQSEITPKKRALVYLGVVLHMIGDVYSHRTIIPKYTVSNNLLLNRAISNTDYGDKFSGADFSLYIGQLNLNDSILVQYVSGANPYRYGHRTVYTDAVKKRLRSKDAFIKAVNYQVAEFQDIYRFVKHDSSGSYNGIRYDDSSTFCKERFADAVAACKRYTKDVIKKHYQKTGSERKFITFSAGYIMPRDIYVKINNFKDYTAKASLSVTSLVGIEDDSVPALWNIHSTIFLV